MTGTDLTEIYPDIEKAARTIALEWPNIIDQDDAVQEISLALLSDDYVAKVIAMDEAARRNVLHKIATHIAANYRADYERHSGQYRYGSREVRAILDRGALSEQHERFDAGAADVRDAWHELNGGHRAALSDRYIDGHEPGNATERKNVSRAVDALTELLNRAMRAKTAEGHPGPGTRSALSNAQAAVLTRRDT